MRINGRFVQFGTTVASSPSCDIAVSGGTATGIDRPWGLPSGGWQRLGERDAPRRCRFARDGHRKGRPSELIRAMSARTFTAANAAAGLSWVDESVAALFLQSSSSSSRMLQLAPCNASGERCLALRITTGPIHCFASQLTRTGATRRQFGRSDLRRETLSIELLRCFDREHTLAGHGSSVGRKRPRSFSSCFSPFAFPIPVPRGGTCRISAIRRR